MLCRRDYQRRDGGTPDQVGEGQAPRCRADRLFLWSFPRHLIGSWRPGGPVTWVWRQRSSSDEEQATASAIVLWQTKITGFLVAPLGLRKSPGARRVLWYNRIFSF